LATTIAVAGLALATPHAQGVQAASVRLRLSCPAGVAPMAPTIAYWIGSSSMTVSAIGQHCYNLYNNIAINSVGNVSSLPGKMVPDTYLLVTTSTSSLATCQNYGGVSYCGTLNCSVQPNNVVVVNGDGSNTVSGKESCSGNLSSGGLRHFFNVSSNYSGGGQTIGGGITGGGTATPELSPFELLMLGLVPTLGVLWYLRRRQLGRGVRNASL
jgi:hypothetical protein